MDSGAHPAGGRHPTGCSGQPGGVLNRHPTAAGSSVWSVSIPAPVPRVNPDDREEIPAVARRLLSDSIPPRPAGRAPNRT